jgi:hypothetical protein
MKTKIMKTKNKTKVKIKNLYIEHGNQLNPAYVLQLARAKYKYCRIVYGDYGNHYVFTSRKVSTRQAEFMALKKAKKFFTEVNLNDFALQA